MSKYNARKVQQDGYTFDSLAEHRRYNELVLLRNTGALTDLEVHPRIELIPAFEHDGKRERATYYEADFSYCMKMDDGYHVVYEDVKGFKTQSYLIKKKLLLWRYPDIWFRELKA